MDTAITRTLGSGAATTTYTLSFWCKKAASGSYQRFFTCNGTGDVYFRFNNTEGLELSAGGSDQGVLNTNRKFRDSGAWYHFVIRYDSTEVSANDRFRLYINGVDERDVGGYSTSTMPSSSQTDNINLSGNVHRIGGLTGQYFGGEMSHMHLCIGYSYAPTEFGEVDSTSGIWKLIADPSVSYGTNGFFLKFEDRTNLDLDSSPNANTFATAGTLTPTKDTPSNNFCTMNPIVGARSGFTWSNGNNKVVTGTVDNSGATLAFGSGKWYYEILTDTRGNAYPGWQDLTNTEADEDDTYTPPGFLGINPGVTYNAGSGVVFSSFKGLPASDWTDGDYIGLAFDMDNLSAWWSLNGQWYTGDNATPTTLTRAQVSADTNGFDCSTASLFSSASLIAPCMGSSTASTTNSFNFGNGVFASTVLGGTTYNDDAGNGIFKYEPPDGFRAICTKNIKAYG